MSCTYAADIIDQAGRWLRDERPVVVATIIALQGSSSRPLASRMVCTDREEYSGSVSGGCVETDVCRVAREVISDGTPRVIHYGPVRDPLLEVGLNCEGRIEVLLERVDEQWIREARKESTGVIALQCRMERSDPGSGAVSPASVRRTWYPREMAYGEGLVRDAWEAGAPRSIGTTTGILLAEPVLPPPQLLIFGAGPLADDLARLARVLGYTTVISDPRETRFAPGGTAADQVYVSWPAETLEKLIKPDLIPARTFVVSLEHEPRFEDALWEALLRNMAGGMDRPRYIGAIGKAQRAIERDERARERGLDLSPLQPIRTPVGLDIGGKSPAEIALSILAEIVATIHDRPGGAIGALRPL